MTPKNIRFVFFVWLVLFFEVAVRPASAEFNWCQIFNNCPAAKEFVPTYEANPQLISPFIKPTPLNQTYFADEKTTAKTCSLIPGCLGSYVAPVCLQGGGPNVCDKPQRVLRFAAGDKNAGFLAKYWDNYATSDAALRAALADLGR